MTMLASVRRLKRITLLCAACSGAMAGATTPNLLVRRTSYGVLHVEAKTYAGLGYGFGFAYASDNLCLLADQIVTSRGLRSRFFGIEGGHAQNLASDIFVKAELPDRKLVSMFAKTSQDGRDLIRGFVAGYNRYLAVTSPEARDPACGRAEWLMPLRVTDVYRMIASKAGTETQFAASIADAKPLQSAGDSDHHASREPVPGHNASNGWAFGRDVTADGHGLLLANPHFPWSGENRFYQLHLRIPGKLDVMGATIAPLPVVAIGFNNDVAWTHTVSPATRFTLFRLDLDPADPFRYTVDGRSHAIIRKNVIVLVKGKDGIVRREQHSVSETGYGPVVTAPQLGLTWDKGQAFALADVNKDNIGQIDTWLAYGRSRSVADIKNASEKSVAMPWLTTTAADRTGSVLFGDFSRSPAISTDTLKACRISAGDPDIVLLDGSRSSCDWTHHASRLPYVTGQDLPSLVRNDYVANSNGSYWLVNDAVRLPRSYPLMGAYATPQNYRTRMGIEEIRSRIGSGSAKSFTPQLVQDILFSDRDYVALTFLDDVLSLCPKDGAGNTAPNGKLAAACHVLKLWDRRDALESRGAVLFREFWSTAANIPNLFAFPFSPDDPANTPRKLRVDDPVVADSLRATLLAAVETLGKNRIPLDRPLGDVQGVIRNGERIPVQGGASDEGILNTMLTTPLDPNGYVPVHGTSYVQIVGFDDRGPVARGLLAYGQSTDSRSPWSADQTRLFAQNQLYPLPFSPTEITADAQVTTIAMPDDPVLHGR